MLRTTPWRSASARSTSRSGSEAVEVGRRHPEVGKVTELAARPTVAAMIGTDDLPAGVHEPLGDVPVAGDVLGDAVGDDAEAPGRAIRRTVLDVEGDIGGDGEAFADVGHARRRYPSCAAPSPKRRRRRLLPTTLTDENAIAAPAMSGLRSPAAARGMAAVL